MNKDLEKREMEQYLKQLNIPENEILFLHVRLKGIMDKFSYRELSQQIVTVLNNLYKPKTILVPTFTYSYTKTGVYNQTSSPSEVGRFGEEIREQYPTTHRTINPVFNVIDTNNYFQQFHLKEETAFGEDSILHMLHDLGHVVININVDKFISTYLHYLEFAYKVPYRYIKNFPGEVISSNTVKKDIVYQYFVRDLEKDTTWDREKIKKTLQEEGVLKVFNFEHFEVMWTHSKQMENILGSKLETDKNFLLKNGE
ncbi:AAC(3) family N-acetyltransferase [Zunongwangia sp. H14]|uniref:AAC(3) family N-acetyltransferase n=1 Tax=Zunongwangia sp. H14 TaxID=3240792 RepID=UPI0035683E16